MSSRDPIVLASDKPFEVFITDEGESLAYNLADYSAKGSSSAIRIGNFSSSIGTGFSYKIELEKNSLLEGCDCSVYNEESRFKTYAECVDAEARKEFLPLLGCIMPWMSTDVSCTSPVQINSAYVELMKSKNFWGTFESGAGIDYKACPRPCDKMNIRQKYLRSFDSKEVANFLLKIYFEDNVKYDQSIPAYNYFDFVVEVGSSLGLWLGLSMIGVFDVVVLFMKEVRVFKKNINTG